MLEEKAHSRRHNHSLLFLSYLGHNAETGFRTITADQERNWYRGGVHLKQHIRLYRKGN